MRITAIVNQKGGCGKTTTAINLASIYARRGFRTLLVDMDPQAHCAAGLGVPEDSIEYSIADGLLADLGASFDPERLTWEVCRNLHLAPSTMRLAGLEAPGGGLHRLEDRDRRLERLLRHMADRYDRCLIDCPPTIGLLTFNALRAARETLIPVETSFFALKGAEKQWTTIRKLIERIDRPIACHLVATLHDPTSEVAERILAQLRRDFAGQLLPVVIRHHEALREATSFGQPVVEYAPESDAMKDFDALADWLEDHIAPPVPYIDVMPVEPTRRSVLPEVEETTEPTTVPRRIAPLPEGRGGGQEMETSGVAPGNRAAELARRVHTLAQRQAGPHQALRDEIQRLDRFHADRLEAVSQSSRNAPSAAATEPQPVTTAPAPTTVTVSEAPVSLSQAPTAEPTTTGCFGPAIGAGGEVTFREPRDLGAQISVAGDFNMWSATATVLEPRGDVMQATVVLKPGRYQYRLVVDGAWRSDPNNAVQAINGYGEPNSIVVVPDEGTGQ